MHDTDDSQPDEDSSPLATVIFTERFKNDLLQVHSKKVRDRIMNDMDLLQHVPELGSKEMPASITERFGSNIRKLVIGPFLVLYKTLPETNAVLVLGMVNQRQAR